MSSLSAHYTRIQPLSTLLVVRGEPVLLLPELVKRWGITHVVFERDPCGYAARRDSEVLKLMKEQGVEVLSKNGHYLYDPEEIAKKHGAKPVTSMSQLQKVISGMPAPPQAFETPTSFPAPLPQGEKEGKDLKGILAQLAKSLEGMKAYKDHPGAPDFDLNSQKQNDGQRTDPLYCYDTVQGEPDGKAIFQVPTLESLGMNPEKAGVSPESAVPGGEDEALKRLGGYVNEKASYLATFAKPKTSPSTDFANVSTTLMSPYLKFGCMGIRRLWYDVRKANKEAKASAKTSIPENYEGQLLFREMYAAAEVAVGAEKFGKVEGNSLSRYVGSSPGARSLSSFG